MSQLHSTGPADIAKPVLTDQDRGNANIIIPKIMRTAVLQH